MILFGKTISLFLIEGDPNRRWVCELSNWNGKAYKIPVLMSSVVVTEKTLLRVVYIFIRQK